MNFNKNRMVPGFISRVTSVWYRHVRVYMSSFFSNAFPPFFEPLIFLAGLGIGIGSYIDNMGGMSYPLFLASGLIVTSSMHTAAFECTFGTFIRLEFDKVYDGMLGAPISVRDLVIGEILFAGTKGAFFAFAVLIVTWIFGIIREPMSIFTIVIGFITGILFAAISMYITSFVRNINHFNFYLTGVISPMFFFSGVVFPVENLPSSIRWVTEFMPLTHVVKMARAFCVTELLSWALLYNLLIVLLFIVVTGGLAIKGLKKRLII